MIGSDFFSLSIAVQAAIGAGYLGYVTAYAGYRRYHKTEDAVFISVAFSSIALFSYGLADRYLGAAGAVAAAFVSSLAVAFTWRKWGRRAWLLIVSSIGVHRDDGAFSAWDEFAQTDRLVDQAYVVLKSGRTLCLNDRRAFFGAPWNGLYLGGDGSVIMVVEDEDLPDGTCRYRETIKDDLWGTRMTYVPADEIARVELRMK